MKYTSKTEYYESPNPNQGVFKNPYAVTTMPKKWIGDDGQTYFQINFDLMYDKSGIPVLIERGQPITFGEHQETTILNANDEEQELNEFLQGGGIYDKNRIVKWGRPSAVMMETVYLKPETLWSGSIQFTEQQPQRQIAIDWVDVNIRLQGIPCGEHFELEEIEVPE